jgi:hypothetical protein
LHFVESCVVLINYTTLIVFFPHTYTYILHDVYIYNNRQVLMTV